MARKTKIQPFSYDPDTPQGKWLEEWIAELKRENKNISACILDRLYEASVGSGNGGDDNGDRMDRLEREIDELKRAVMGQGSGNEVSGVAKVTGEVPESWRDDEAVKQSKRPNVRKFFK
jgi:hypothetical protein